MTVQRGFAPILIILLILVSVAVGAGGYHFFSNYQIEPNPKSGGVISNLPFTSESKASYLEGKLKKLDTDLGLIVLTEEEKINDTLPKVFYYEAGKYISGDYKGYTRYIALRAAIDPSGSALYIFASKDGKKYIFDQANNPTYLSQDPLYEIDKTKIEKIAVLPTDHNQIISLNNTFALNKNTIPTTAEKTGQKDKNGYDIYNEIIDLSYASNPTLKSTEDKLTFYADKEKDPDQAFLNSLSKEYKDALPYLEGSTLTTVVDSTGLPYSYDLTRPSLAKDYPPKYQKYQKELKDFENNPNKETAAYPDYPMRPNLRLTKNEITTTSPVYDNYDLAIPHMCALDVNTRVAKNITEADLTKLGSSPDGELFILKDKNQPLLKYAYQMKIGDVDNTGYEEVNKSPKPTYEQYVSKNPLLFLKDYWGRWVMLGEYDVKLIGGCGKPVIYLYPEKETEVSVKLNVQVKFDETIPEYNGGWKVKAYPDGKLVDLQNSKTYPFLYWSGQVVDKKYPKIEKGWVVEKNNLENFLTEKFDEMGFSQQEKKDFLDYWVPTMLKKDAPYYRVSFLNTRQLNEIFPMEINPAPKNIYRIFMDWTPLFEKPETPLIPQNLEKIKRDGFTLIEWGGLKR